MARLEDLPKLKRALLLRLKRGRAPITELAGSLRVTGEAVRQQLAALERKGWVRRREAPRSGAPGRPRALYSLTVAAEELFPKSYDALAFEVLDVASHQLPMEAREKVLAALAQARVRRLEPAVRGLPLEKRLEKLRSFYAESDPFMSVEKKGEEWRLVERNCPYLSVAMRRPAICSVTVHALSRLLGRRVSREERFQHSHGRCAFIVKEDKAPAAFELER